ncbi:hypothetical protein Cgig2_018834 [Carnegiea gigantea]|uniref:Uncharacterized protein n=1 Tax=Carnegiea gigantea TaxID=171969 RepID=A0A9Q1QJ37_9CARY|nr:hypothetical protein Cgig2_018834 [Carnegiea gigantea]
MFSGFCETNLEHSSLHDSNNEDNDSMTKEDEIPPSSQDQEYRNKVIEVMIELKKQIQKETRGQRKLPSTAARRRPIVVDTRAQWHQATAKLEPCIPTSTGDGKVVFEEENEEESGNDDDNTNDEIEYVTHIKTSNSCVSILNGRRRGNFKSGDLVKLKEMMNAKCPGYGLKAYPHIDSKTKWFRDKYNVLVKMFTHLDSVRMTLPKQSSVQDNLNHKNAKGLWDVPFPFLDELEKIFGIDRATTASCENYVATVDNLQNDNEAIDVDKDREDQEEEELSQFN